VEVSAVDSVLNFLLRLAFGLPVWFIILASKSGLGFSFLYLYLLKYMEDSSYYWLAVIVFPIPSHPVLTKLCT
jgi:hypothetical protein